MNQPQPNTPPRRTLRQRFADRRRKIRTWFQDEDHLGATVLYGMVTIAVVAVLALGLAAYLTFFKDYEATIGSDDIAEAVTYEIENGNTELRDALAQVVFERSMSYEELLAAVDDPNSLIREKLDFHVANNATQQDEVLTLIRDNTASEDQINNWITQYSASDWDVCIRVATQGAFLRPDIGIDPDAFCEEFLTP